ncbi:MAG: hypothetical protein ACYDBV_11170, partial [Nitrospiria bacterium]
DVNELHSEDLRYNPKVNPDAEKAKEFDQHNVEKDAPDHLIDTPLHLVDPVLKDKIQKEANNLEGELDGSYVEKKGRRYQLENVGEGWVARKTSSPFTINTFPDWFKSLGRGKEDVAAALRKVIEDEGKDKGALVEKVKAIILDHLQNGREMRQPDVWISGQKQRGDIVGEIPPDADISEFLNQFGDNKVNLEDFNRAFKEFNDQTSFPFSMETPPKEVPKEAPMDFDLSEPVKEENKVNEPQQNFSAEKPGEQIKMEGLPQPKVPEGFITKEGGKGEETTPLFNQNEQSKGQQKLFDQDLQSTPLPGLKQFAEQDLSKLMPKIMEGIDNLRKIFLPASWGKEGKMTAMLSRIRIAELVRRREQAFNTFKQAMAYFDKKSNEENLKFINGAETGKYEGTPAEQAMMKQLQELLKEKYKFISEKYTGSDSFIENYFPHFWKDPERAKEAFSDVYKRSQLEGQKGFMKKRVIPTTMEGIKLGLEPVDYNPVRLTLAKIHEMDKFQMAQDLFGDFKEKGLIKYFKLGDRAPSDWRQLNDPMGRVYNYSEDAGGLVYRGNYYMPEKAANVINNYLSPGLQNNPFYIALRSSGNLLNQFQLGLSGFHALFTTQDVMISKLALGIQQFTQGNFLDAGKSVLGIPLSPITNFIKGNELLKDYYSKNPVMTKAIDNLMRAGGRARMDSFYFNNAVEGWARAWRSGNPIGGVLRTPGALIEMLAKPLMQELVPRQKLGVFFDMAENINKMAADKGLDWTTETKLLQEAWDSVDNRMGQMTYDNLFWNKSLKDLSMGTVRSVGWNLGDLREIGGAPVDLGKQTVGAIKGEGFRVTPKMAYVLALPIISGMVGAITNYLYTGEPPKELKDYYFPRTGKKNPDGTPERISIPGYMRDVFAYGIKPMETVSSKLHPLVSDIIQMLNNKDYYGYEIVNPDDPLVQKVGEWADYIGKSSLPFSIQGAKKRQQAGEGIGGQLQAGLGINPASKYITNTATQNEIDERYDKRFGGGTKPYSQKEVDQAKSDLRRLHKQNSPQFENKLKQYVDSGLIDLKSNFVKELDKNSAIPQDVRMFQRLPSVDQAGILKDHPEDMSKYLPYAQSELFKDSPEFLDMLKPMLGKLPAKLRVQLQRRIYKKTGQVIE